MRIKIKTEHIAGLAPSSVLEVRVEDVRPAPAHLGPLDVGRTSVELRLIPLALMHLIPPLHALLGGDLWLRLILVNVEAAELLDLQVLASILGRILMDLLREARDSQADIISGRRGLVLLWHIEAMVVCDKALPVRGVRRLLVAVHVHVEGQLVLIG